MRGSLLKVLAGTVAVAVSFVSVRVCTGGQEPGAVFVPPDGTKLPLPAGENAVILGLSDEGCLLLMSWKGEGCPSERTYWLWCRDRVKSYKERPAPFAAPYLVRWKGRLHLFDIGSMRLHPFDPDTGIGQPVGPKGNFASIVTLRDGSCVTGGRVLAEDETHYLTIRGPELDVRGHILRVGTPLDPDEWQWVDWVTAVGDSKDNIWVMMSTAPEVMVFDGAGRRVGGFPLDKEGFIPHPAGPNSGDPFAMRAKWTPLVHFSLYEDLGFLVTQWVQGHNAEYPTLVHDLGGRRLWRGTLDGVVWHAEKGKLHYLKHQGAGAGDELTLTVESAEIGSGRSKDHEGGGDGEPVLVVDAAGANEAEQAAGGVDSDSALTEDERAEEVERPGE